jgi:hypothetical protein
LAEAVLGLEAGCFFAAGAVTPKTDSLRALAGVKRSRVRAGILICSPVAGFAPDAGCELALAKDAQSPEPDCAFLFQLAHHEQIQFVERHLGVFFRDANVLGQIARNAAPGSIGCSITCDCVILNLGWPSTLMVKRPEISILYRLNGVRAEFKYRAFVLRATEDHRQSWSVRSEL